MTYQRGTDLKHCPDECECLVLDKQPGDRIEVLCCAINDDDPTDTCPREQAEKPVNHHCDKCRAETCSMCGYATGDWKERTNGN